MIPIRHTAAALALLCAMTACTSKQQRQADLANGDDPLQALAADAPSTRYGSAFWAQQSDSNTDLWRKAQAYCAQYGVSARGQKVNCGAVSAARYEETARHPERSAPGALRP